MKKMMLVLMILFLSASVSLFAEDSEKSSSKNDSFDAQGLKFGVGAFLAFKSPIIASGLDGNFKYNEEFEAGLKNISIDEFLFGLPLRLDWIWEQDSGFALGIQLDLDTCIMPTGDYADLTSGLADIIKAKIEGISGGGEGATTDDYDLELGLRADLTPMFVIQYKIFRFGIGLGMSLDMNISQTADAVKALKGEDSDSTIGEHLTSIGLDPTEVAVTDSATLRSSLTAMQQMAFYGFGMDLHLKGNFDFMLGKHIVVGGTFLIRFNSQMARWDTDADINTNFAEVFDANQFEGLIGIRFLWMF